MMFVNEWTPLRDLVSLVDWLKTEGSVDPIELPLWEGATEDLWFLQPSLTIRNYGLLQLISLGFQVSNFP